MCWLCRAVRAECGSRGVLNFIPIGPTGAVIYWFDYVEDAKTLSSWREQGLIAIKAMPTPDSVVHRTDLPTARGTWAGDAQASLA